MPRWSTTDLPFGHRVSRLAVFGLIVATLAALVLLTAVDGSLGGYLGTLFDWWVRLRRGFEWFTPW